MNLLRIQNHSLQPHSNCFVKRLVIPKVFRHYCAALCYVQFF